MQQRILLAVVQALGLSLHPLLSGLVTQAHGLGCLVQVVLGVGAVEHESAAWELGLNLLQNSLPAIGDRGDGGAAREAAFARGAEELAHDRIVAVHAGHVARRHLLGHAGEP